ncbi:MAG: carbohydrate binding domain-containing protein [Oscillospiraceae bacterium]|nr:carbohydrate binding domain-containing protein [Oscillospiraceae bacterium]
MFIRKRTGKLSAALLVSAVTLSSVSAFPMQGFAADDAAFIFHDTFESGDGGWTGRGGCTVKTSSDMPYEGNGALFVSGRSDAWNGPEKSLSSI